MVLFFTNGEIIMNIPDLRSRPRCVVFFLLFIILIIAFCAFSGCISEKTQSQPVTQNLSQHLATDIVIPVDLPSDLASSNIMTKKNGVPAGSLIYEGLVTKDRNGNWIPVSRRELERFR